MNATVSLPRTMIAVPSISGRINARLSYALSEFARFDGRAGNIEITPLSYCHPIAYARNRLVGKFLAHSKADVLWMIDDDMVPPAGALALLMTPGDIVSAASWAQFRLPQTKQWRVSLHGYRRSATGHLVSVAPSEGEMVMDVDAVGTGCIVIRRHVLEDARLHLPEPPAPEMLGRQIEHEEPFPVPNVFRHPMRGSGRWLLGEDLDFTLRAKALGYSLRYDLRHLWGHRKEVDLRDVVALAIESVGEIDSDIDILDASGRPAKETIN